MWWSRGGPFWGRIWRWGKEGEEEKGNLHKEVTAVFGADYTSESTGASGKRKRSAWFQVFSPHTVILIRVVRTEKRNWLVPASPTIKRELRRRNGAHLSMMSDVVHLPMPTLVPHLMIIDYPTISPFALSSRIIVPMLKLNFLMASDLLMLAECWEALEAVWHLAEGPVNQMKLIRRAFDSRVPRGQVVQVRKIIEDIQRAVGHTWHTLLWPW